jgi:hypothetical protein
MSSRYSFIGGDVPQPIRKVLPAYTDVIHNLKLGERIDNLAFKYYKDPTLAWVIMCANPEFENEFDIPVGSPIRIPWPLQRVFTAWQIDDEI